MDYMVKSLSDDIAQWSYEKTIAKHLAHCALCNIHSFLSISKLSTIRHIRNMIRLIVMMIIAPMIYIYRVSVKKGRSRGWEHERVKENKKSLIPF